MTSFRIRPKFSITTPKRRAAILEALQLNLQQEEASCQGIAIEGHIILKVLPTEEHYWSPQLSILLDEEEIIP